jgi:hypothetical protein
MAAAAARDVGRIARRWANQLGGTLRGNFACYEQHEKLRSGAAACFAAATDPFLREQTALATAIHTARPMLQGACGQLATAALITTHVLALDLSRLASAASSTDRAALPTALATVGTEDTNLDLTGQLERFLILCTPRGSA